MKPTSAQKRILAECANGPIGEKVRLKRTYDLLVAAGLLERVTIDGRPLVRLVTEQRARLD